MSRSGSSYSTPRDANRVPFLIAASTADGMTPVVLEADPTTHSLAVSASVSPASDTTQTGSIAGPGESVTFAVNAQSTVGIQASGTFSGTILIKGSVDGSTYTPTTATNLSTGALVTTITSSFTGQVNVAGFVSFQLTSVSWTSGTANISLRASTGISNIMLDNPLPAGTNTIGAVTQTTASNLNTTAQITDGTNIVNVLKSDGTAAGQNAQLVAPAYKEIGSLTAGALNADLVPSTDVSGYATFMLQITGTFVGTLTLQGSNDNTNFSSVYGTWINNTQPVSTATTTGIISGSCNFRYFRVRMTAYTSGSATGTLELKTIPFAQTNVLATISGSAITTPVNARNTGSITTASSSILSTSASGYSWAYVTISGTYAGISFGITASDNGGTNYYNVPVWDVQNQKYIAPGTTITPTDNSSSSYYVPQSSNTSIVKVLATAYTSGTGSVAITSMSNAPFMVSQAIQSFNATGSAVPTSAYYQGGLAQTALPTAATAGNLTGKLSDKFGRSVVLNNAFRDIVASQTTTISASTAETTVITAAASIFNDLSAIWVSNTSTTAARVDFRDTTAGSVLFQLYVPGGDIRGVSFNTPFPQTSVNTNWTAQSSASVTDLRITALYIKNK